jgi:hypothetical protein
VKLLLAIAALCFGLATSAGATTPTLLRCGSLTTGPTALPSGGSRGALCLLRAYRQHCRPAVYELATFGIDTIARDDFRVVGERGRCRVQVTTTFTVVPQKPRRQGSGLCSVLDLQGTDVVASGCLGAGLPESLSLTGKR